MYFCQFQKSSFLAPAGLCGQLTIMEFLRRLLQSMGILTTSKIEDKNDYPSAGTFVPVDYHEYLDNNFHVFCKGDHVAYEVYDPRFQETYNTEPRDSNVIQLTDSTDAVYVHTIILGEVQEEIDRGKEKPALLRKYEIDLGGNRTATVPATKLYRFLFEEEETIASREHIDNYTPLPHDSTSNEEILLALKEAKLLPKEEDRICACKRLVLKGQGDHKESFSCFVKALAENILDEEKLDKLFWADIAKPIHVVEQGWSDKDEVDAYPKESQPVRGQGVPWTIIGNKRGCQRGLRRTCGMWTVGCNPQRSEGLRWFRQAQADLQTAMSAMGSYSQGFNWICFLCHQVGSYLIMYVYLIIHISFVWLCGGDLDKVVR